MVAMCRWYVLGLNIFRLTGIPSPPTGPNVITTLQSSCFSENLINDQHSSKCFSLAAFVLIAARLICGSKYDLMLINSAKSRTNNFCHQHLPHNNKLLNVTSCLSWGGGWLVDSLVACLLRRGISVLNWILPSIIKSKKNMNNEHKKNHN